MTAAPPPAAWHDTARDFPRAETITSLVDAAADTHPGRPALVSATGAVTTHAQLREWTDRFANLLASLGVGRGDFVALYSDRTPAAVAAVLAVVKAGAAYVPIDPAWPRRRAVALMSGMDVRAVVTCAAWLKAVQELRWDVPGLRHVLCPEIETETSWAPVLDRETVEEFFDFLSGEPDPLDAAGFNLRRSDRPYTPADVAAYRDHVASLAVEAAGHDAAILEIGSGSGLIVEALGPTAGRYVAVDPSAVAVRRNLAAARRDGFRIEGRVGFAHEVASSVDGPFDLVVMASTVQFLPDMAYLVDTLRSLTGLVSPGGTILLCDLIDPELEQHAGLRVPPAMLRRLPSLVPGIATVEIRRRDPDGFAGELRTRYDAFLRVAGVAPATADRLVWTGAHIAARPADPPAPPSPTDTAYAIFTSGSTGTPKGVLVRHRSVVNLIDWMNRTYRVGPADRVLGVASFCFDLSVYDMFGLLAAGGSVRLATEAELAEPETLVDVLESEPVTVWDSAPAALAMLTPFLEFRDVARAELRLVLLSGDWIPLTLPDEVRAAFPAAEVVALGGATECTVWSNHFPVGAVDPAWPSIPYGRPMQNARYYVLDADRRPCPVGTPGDLYIAGECVAAGYANDPGLTAAKFLADPWVPGERMYHTGDRARWLPGGDVEFLGRLDDQVKVRGYRIELGEVQSAVAQCPGVRGAAVLAVDVAGGKDLVAFYVPARQGPGPDEVRAFLATILPAHMIPNRVLSVDTLPLRDTGKVDRTALLKRVA